MRTCLHLAVITVALLFVMLLGCDSPIDTLDTTQEGSSSPAGTAPAAPSGLSATAVSSSQINLSWTDNADNETGFRIERSTTSSSSGFEQMATVDPDVITYSNTGLSASTQYWYRVQAYNSADHSSWSNTATATTQAPAASPPAAPSGLSATAVSASQINLTWTNNADNETGFRIERSSTSSTSGFTLLATAGASATTYSNTGLNASTQYWYRVQAYNAAGNSSWSNTASATTQAPAASVPAAPSGLSATAVSASQINLSWTDNANNETGFRIERSSTSATSGFTQIATPGSNATSYSNSGLTASTQYWYRVRAYNAAGNSSWSNIATVTTQAPAPSAPAAPGGLSATAVSASQINLSWTDNANNETGFRIERSSTSGSTGFSQIGTVGANVTAHSSTSLNPNTTYWYRVRAYNSVGNSSYSNTASATTRNAPSLTGPSSATGPFSVTWSFTWPDLVSTTDRYVLEHSYSPTTGFSVIVQTPNNVRTSPYTATLFPDAGDIGKTSYFRVRALSNSTYTAYSNVIAVSIPQINVSFHPTHDNLLMYDSTNSAVGNTVYQTSSLAVGANYLYGMYVDSYLVGFSAFRFDINSTIAGGTIQKATLRLRPQNLPADYGTTYGVRAFSASWNPATITYNNMPNVYTGAAYTSSKSPPSSTSVDWEIDVTGIVQAWANGTFANNGFLLYDANIAWPGYTALRGFDIHSLEASSSSVRPRLYIEIR